MNHIQCATRRLVFAVFAYDSYFGDLKMKKLFAFMVVFAALMATGCGKKDTTTAPPAAAPADEKADETPAEPAAP